MIGVWILTAVCLALVAALSWTLQHLYRLKVLAPGGVLAAPSSPAPNSGLDQLLTMLLALHEYGVARTGTVSHEELCTLILEDVCGLLGSKRGKVLLHDENKGSLYSVASKVPFGPVREEPASLRELAQSAFSGARPIAGSDRKEPALAVPMMLGSRPVGVIVVQDPPQGLLPEDPRIRLLTLLGTEASLALHHQKMYDDLQIFYLEMVQTLARAVDAKDAYAQDHSERARGHARGVAMELGLPEQMVRYVEYATMLHGIGKIGIDQAILSKPGKLTPEEFEQVKKHTAIGHRILAPVKFLGPVSQMVLYHQEWYNGKGYPEGLKGDQIPLGSRIVAVVNAWEAMNSDRPYRKALAPAAAVEQLTKGSGTQFDPKVVEAFLRVKQRPPA